MAKRGSGKKVSTPNAMPIKGKGKASAKARFVDPGAGPGNHRMKMPGC